MRAMMMTILGAALVTACGDDEPRATPEPSEPPVAGSYVAPPPSEIQRCGNGVVESPPVLEIPEDAITSALERMGARRNEIEARLAEVAKVQQRDVPTVEQAVDDAVAVLCEDMLREFRDFVLGLMSQTSLTGCPGPMRSSGVGERSHRGF